jgi:hypothetical protein
MKATFLQSARVRAGIGFAVIAYGGLLSHARAELLTHRDLPYAVALTIAQTAVESCMAKGYPESAVVVDRDGETIVSIRGDGAAPHTVENTRRKAYTALSFHISAERRTMPSAILRGSIQADSNGVRFGIVQRPCNRPPGTSMKQLDRASSYPLGLCSISIVADATYNTGGAKETMPSGIAMEVCIRVGSASIRSC